MRIPRGQSPAAVHRLMRGTTVPLLLLALLASVAACGPFGSTATTAPTPTDTPSSTASGTSDWLTFGFDAARSGVNPNEATITPANASRLHRLWRANLPAAPDAPPAYAHGVTLPNGATRDLLFFTTRDGRILAVDANGGGVIWAHQPHGVRYTTSSPVVDPGRQYVYSYGLDGMLHRYALATGDETTGNGWPALVSHMTQTEKQSATLNLANGRVYVTTAGYPGDAPPYQGHVVIVDGVSGGSKVFNSLCANVTHVLAQGECSANQSGIWARAGTVVDPETGNVFVTTGNGPYDANHGGDNYGESVIALRGDGTHALDSYTPANYQALTDTDTDLGSTEPALLPRITNSKTPLLAVQGGKDAKLRLLNRQNLSGQGGLGHVGGELQTLSSPGCGVFDQPVVWTDPASKAIWVFVGGTCGLGGYQAVTDGAGVTRLQQVWKNGDTGTTPVLAGGVLFQQESGAVLALDPRTGKTLWSSKQSSAGGSTGNIHWQSVIVVNGRVYAADENAALTAYGL
jgi:outer membrane protein assembly factor BamB